MDRNDLKLTNQVKTMREILERAGWETKSVYDLVTKDGVLWYTSTFTHGEYTVETSYRPRGYGRAEGATRVRITPALLLEYPNLGPDLANGLLDKQLELQTSSVGSIEDLAWPPPLWKDLAR